MRNGFDYNRHGGDFPTLRDDEIELLLTALSEYESLALDQVGHLPREHRDAFNSLYLKAANSAAQRKIGPYGG